jgi:MoxR-like ATPase
MSEFDLAELKDSIERESQFIHDINTSIRTVIIGQDNLIETLLLAILTDGHVFLEGVPGLAKTLTINSLAQIIDTKFQRLQFTPDLLPADILGTLIYNPIDGSFEVKKGPIFANIILADEINRAPAKVQSALLEAMQERQITIGDKTFKLENPFLVMATQNPIEQEGTYPLPEAQIDRFMFKVLVGYPNPEEELEILKRMGKINSNIELKPVVNPSQILSARKIVDQIYMAENIQKYIVSLVFATRYPEKYGLKDLQSLITYGASPRATIFLANASKSYAFLHSRGFVIPEDVRAVGKSILRHRIILSYEAEAEEITTEDIIQRIYESVPTP